MQPREAVSVKTRRIGGLILLGWTMAATAGVAQLRPSGTTRWSRETTEAELLAGPQIGAVHVVPGYLFVDGFQSGVVGGWSSATP